MIDVLRPLVKQFMPFAQKRFGFTKPPRMFLKQDEENARNPLGRTAYYDPEQMSITLYTTGRHPKDVMRSLAHELVHHTQNCNGMFDNVGSTGEGYAQNDEHLREMEREAYEQGNLCFRDWEDSIKNTIYFEHLQKGDNVMSTKKWKNKELNGLLTEGWGFSMDLSKLSEGKEPMPDFPDVDGDGNRDEPIKQAAADKKSEDSEVQEEGKKECPKCKKDPCVCPKDKKMEESNCGMRDDDMGMDMAAGDMEMGMDSPEAIIAHMEEMIDDLKRMLGMGEQMPMEPMMAMGDEMMEDKKEAMNEAVLRERIRGIIKNVKFKK